MRNSTTCIGRFDSAIEAEIAKTVLNSQQIECWIENEFLGTILPHASQALGGIRLIVNLEDEEKAKQLLQLEPVAKQEELPPAEKESSVHNLMKRATYGAVIGGMLLPIVANLFSISLYTKAYKLNSKIFWQHKGLILCGVIFNLSGLLLLPWLFLKLYFNN